MSAEPIKIVPGRSDAELAAEYRAAAGAKLAELCAIMNEAKSYGLIVGFQLNTDPYGRFCASPVTVVRPL